TWSSKGRSRAGRWSIRPTRCDGTARGQWSSGPTSFISAERQARRPEPRRRRSAATEVDDCRPTIVELQSAALLVVVEDRAGARAVAEGGIRRPSQVDGELLRGFGKRSAKHGDRNRLRGDARREGERACRGGVVAARDCRPV